MLLGRPRRAGVTLLAVILVAIGLGVFANSRASYDTAPDTIVDPGSTAFRHEVEFENTFGADPFVMLLRTDVKGLLGGDGLVQEVNAEGNLYTARNRQLGVKTLFGPAAIATVAANAILGAFFGQLQQAGTNAYNDAFKAAKAAAKEPSGSRRPPAWLGTAAEYQVATGRHGLCGRVRGAGHGHARGGWICVRP